jgi:predicted RNA binding protein YcfA (HicA-like mRNA interferase family)
MKSISGKKLAQILEKKGWILVKTKGSHFKYQKKSLIQFLYQFMAIEICLLVH